MLGILCFAGQNVPRKMDGEGLPYDGCLTVSAGLGLDQVRIRNAAELTVQFFLSLATRCFLLEWLRQCCSALLLRMQFYGLW